MIFVDEFYFRFEFVLPHRVWFVRSMIANAAATADTDSTRRPKPTSTIDTFANPCFDEDVDAGSQRPRKRTADKAALVAESSPTNPPPRETNPPPRNSIPAKRRSSIRNRKPSTQTIQTVRFGCRKIVILEGLRYHISRSHAAVTCAYFTCQKFRTHDVASHV